MTIAKLKDGREVCGSIWEWRPKEGWFTLTDDENVNGGGPVRVELADCVSVGTMDARFRPECPPEGEFRDDLVRARRDGWTG